MGGLMLVCAACTVWVGVSAQSVSDKTLPPLLYTTAPSYLLDAWLKGGERFPAGAKVMLRDGESSRPLVAGFLRDWGPGSFFRRHESLVRRKESAEGHVASVGNCGRWGRSEARHRMPRRLSTAVLSSRQSLGLRAKT